MPAPPVAPTVRPVAGCLFEVVLPEEGPADRWEWVEGSGAPVTLLAAVRVDAGWRFRFRAEAAGVFHLRFRDAGTRRRRRVQVGIVPEEPFQDGRAGVITEEPQGRRPQGPGGR